jgi:SAM-dependent methyltransferase
MPELAEAGCPICASTDVRPVLHRRGVPVHQNLLYPTQDGAIGARRGDLDMRACHRCGFTFNAAFDPALLEYGPEYENSQHHSSAFVQHLAAMVDRIVSEHGITSGRMVEVGCGKGDFLQRLISHPASTAEGIGFDPSYLGPPTAVGGRAHFVPAFYGPDTEVEADVVVCRHVIEHLADPLAVLRAVRAASVTGRTKVFFETPCVDWILRNSVLWDLFYEHCSLFTAHSLGLALTRAGFRVTAVQHVFDGQYLWAEAEAVDGEWPEQAPPGVDEALQLAELERKRLTGWRDHLRELHAAGPVVVWGAGAKGLTFCNLVDPGRELLLAVVDVNPAKQGRYLGGTGHPIIAPESARGAAAAVVLNPNYVAEVRALMTTIDIGTRVLDWMAL